MIGGSSLFVAIMSLIIPAYIYPDIEDNKEEICSYYHGEWEDCNCKLENENLRDEYKDDVAYAEDSYEIEKHEK